MATSAWSVHLICGRTRAVWRPFQSISFISAYREKRRQAEDPQCLVQEIDLPLSGDVHLDLEVRDLVAVDIALYDAARAAELTKKEAP
jgi:hypothetical protein